ncbi:hypothetical protein RRSWK_03799 [Rhodopirellula sp. SWK7]|nr:hypothetical protein RRSWK_03799 [Rhodopirellula sp. SWK7]
MRKPDRIPGKSPRLFFFYTENDRRKTTQSWLVYICQFVYQCVYRNFGQNLGHPMPTKRQPKLAATNETCGDQRNVLSQRPAR